jgi:hypothetical protein
MGDDGGAISTSLGPLGNLNALVFSIGSAFFL